MSMAVKEFNSKQVQDKKDYFRDFSDELDEVQGMNISAEINFFASQLNLAICRLLNEEENQKVL